MNVVLWCGLIIITSNRASTSTRWHFAFGALCICSIRLYAYVCVCCHSNETRAPIANLPSNAQLEGTPYHSPYLHPDTCTPCNSVGVRQGTDRQTAVTNIYFASAMPHENTTTVSRPFVGDYPGESVPEETLTHPSSWSSSNLYQLLPSTMIHSIFLVQITCLAIFLHNLSPCPLWSTSWSGALHLIFHTFLHPISVFFFYASREM